MTATATTHRRLFAILKGELYLSVPALIAAGLDEKNLINPKMSQYRAGVIRSWVNINDEADERIKWILAGSIPSESRRVLEFHYGDLMTAAAKEDQERRCLSIPMNIERAYLVHYSSVRDSRGREAYSNDQVKQLAKCAALMKAYEEYESNPKLLGYKNRTMLAQGLAERWNAEGIKQVKCVNGNKFIQHLAKWKREGCNAFVSGYIGNKNRNKTDDETVNKILLGLASDPHKPNKQQICDCYNILARASNGKLPEVAISTVKNFYDKHIQAITLARDGKKVYSDKLEGTAKRIQPTYADAVWSLDGTTIQLLEKDLSVTYYVFYIFDVHSKAILGASIGATETGDLVWAALKTAIRNTMRCPSLLQYDHGSAIMKGVVQDLMNRMRTLHFPCEAYNARAKWAETYIRNTERVLRSFDNFKGGNITSHSTQIKANPDFLKAIKSQLPHSSVIPQQLAFAVEIYNNTKNKQGITPRQKYGTQSPHRQELGYEESFVLFLINRAKPVEYTREGLILTDKGERRVYWVKGETDDFEFRLQWPNESFEVREDKEDVSAVWLYHSGKFVAMATPKDEYKQAGDAGAEGMTHYDFIRKRKVNTTVLVEKVDAARALIAELLPSTHIAELLYKDSLNTIQGAEQLIELFGQSTIANPVNKRELPSRTEAFESERTDVISKPRVSSKKPAKEYREYGETADCSVVD